MKKEYIVPLTAIICAVILGGSFLGVQLNKQSSIEYQKQVELNYERDLARDVTKKEEERQLNLDWCLDEAREAYWNYVEINMTEKDDGTYWGPNSDWYRAEEIQEAKESNCFKQYK